MIRFTPLNDSATQLCLTYTAPFSNFLKLFKPVFGYLAKRAILQTLQEDRVDLEVHGYPR